MSKKKMRKNSFVEGAMISYIAIVFTKLIGALYNIPFYSIIGDKGGVIYSYAYNIYILFLEISTSGIPIAISIAISEYNSLGKYLTKEKAYKLGLKVVVGVSLIAFVFLQMFAEGFAKFFIGDMNGVTSIAEVASAVRVVSLCLLIVPFLSMKRGYLNGHKFLGPSSSSQVIEQVVRIGFVLIGSYLAIYIFNLGINVGVSVALFGAFLGALAAQMYLLYKTREDKTAFEFEGASEDEAEPSSIILRKIFNYCATIVLVSLTMSIYNIVDLKMLLVGLHNIGYDDSTTQIISSIYSTWIPKIVMIIYALALGLTNSIAPHIAESFARGDMKMVNKKINLSIVTVLAFAVPASIGIVILSEPVYRVFYGFNDFGGDILRFAIIISIFNGLTTVINMAQQSMNRGPQACVNTIIGVLTNAVLDLPLIYFFHNIGLPAYYGALAASMTGQLTSIVLLYISFKRDLGFEFGDIGKASIKILPAAGIMAVVVILLKLVMPVTDGRNLILLLQLGIYAIVGVIVYGFISYKNGMLATIFGQDIVDKIAYKLKLKK